MVQYRMGLSLITLYAMTPVVLIRTICAPLLTVKTYFEGLGLLPQIWPRIGAQGVLVSIYGQLGPRSNAIAAHAKPRGLTNSENPKRRKCENNG